MPFSRLRLRGPKPRAKPRGYPKEAVTLGQQIRRRRLDLGLKQVDLALQLDCSVRTLSLWEQDKVELLARQWPKLRAALGEAIDPVGEGFAGRFRAARLRAGLTQQQLADRAGVHERTVRNTEQGLHRPFRKTLAKIQGVLGPVALEESDK